LQNKTFSTLFIAQNLIQLSAVNSTNNYLKLMLSKSEPLAEGTVIMADEQYAGRGQHGNTWFSQPGMNLTFSIYLRPLFLSITDQFQLNIAVSIGVINGLKEFVKEGIAIKWPNDIYFQDCKLGGILIENSISSGNIKSTIIGIGLNVNQKSFHSELTKRATSLSQILQVDIDLKVILEKICHCIEVAYLNLRSGKSAEQLKFYKENLYQFNLIRNYRSNGRDFRGQITGLSDEGKLIVECEGKAHHYGLKEIEFLDNN
jgi:BirA family biotin operon repressor/biotin-[acetyl-CoA-carboxylase] ligase